MKKRYIVIIICFGVLLVFNEILGISGIEVNLYPWQLLISIITMIPLELLFVFLWKDKNVKPVVRKLSAGLFWFILICFVLGSSANYAKSKKQESSLAVSLQGQMTVLCLDHEWGKI